MTVSRATMTGMRQSSWIRRMFEAGQKLQERLGPEKVYDLSLGNPVAEPPAEFHQRLVHLAASPAAGMHRYMPNAGYGYTRQAVADALKTELKLDFTAGDVIMTCGAAGALNVILKAVLDPGDEVIVISPYFPEYLSYISNHGGTVIEAATGEDFVPDMKNIQAAVSTRTRALIMNSPNNPTGAVYDDDFLSRLGGLLENAGRRHGRPIYLISDEPYRRIIYDGMQYPSPLHHYKYTLVTCSFSKDLSIPGERIGYLAVNPQIEGKEDLVDAFIYCNRILGYVNAPALAQNLVSELQSVAVSVMEYQQARDYLYDSLISSGYEVVKPSGAFYMFPRTPWEDDIGFVEYLMEFGVLAVPGSGFGRPGHMRLSYCVDSHTLEGACAGLAKAMEEQKAR